MSKRNRKLSARARARRERLGYGKGRGAVYQPSLKIQDVASVGRSHRVWLPKTGRIHHTFSDLETYMLYLLHWSEQVIDIREQFPLELQETLILAETCGIRHPRHPKSNDAVVMTTDFVITVGTGLQQREVARTVKYASELDKWRVIEKFEIERLYWQRRDIDWGIVTERDISKPMAQNIALVMDYWDLSKRGIEIEHITDLIMLLTQRVYQVAEPLSQIVSDLDRQCAVPAGTCLSVAYHLIATQCWSLDMGTKLDPAKILPVHAITGSAGEVA